MEVDHHSNVHERSGVAPSLRNDGPRQRPNPAETLSSMDNGDESRGKKSQRADRQTAKGGDGSAGDARPTEQPAQRRDAGLRSALLGDGQSLRGHFEAKNRYSTPELEKNRELSVVQEKLVGPYMWSGDVEVGRGCCHRGQNGCVSLRQPTFPKPPLGL